MNPKGFPLRWLMPVGLMAGARNRRLGTSPDGDAARVCEGPSRGQAALRMALAEPQPAARKPAAACHAIAGSKRASQNRAGDEGPGPDCPIETAVTIEACSARVQLS